MNVSFYIVAFVIVASGIAAISLRNLVHCALALTITFTGLAAAFLQLSAEFVGFAQILVYVGAVAILIVFAILLTRGNQEEAESSRRLPWSGLLIALLVFGVIGSVVQKSRVLDRPETVAPSLRVKDIGHRLMEQYVVPLEIIGLLLTAALIGAAVIALQDKPAPTDMELPVHVATPAPATNGEVAGGPQHATAVSQEHS
jgi:NADH-quinone oxidoreductase subunit J